MLSILFAPFVLAALLGFFASMAVHIAAICGYPAHDHFPGVWGLHMGIFVVFIPAVLKSMASGINNKKDLWKHLPRPQALFGLVLFFYTIFNFMYGMTTLESGSWNESEDKSVYTHTPRGGQPQTVSRETYMRHEATVDRMFSGHWMLFYFVAFTLLTVSPTVPRKMFVSR